MEHSNPTLAKIPILDTGKFEQWKFKIQQYLQHEHYALWEVIKLRDSYVAPQNNAATGSSSEETATKMGKTIAVTTEDMQKRRNDVKARTTLLLAFPNEHQLRFSKYKTAQELRAAILKTFCGNEATKKTKKNLLKQQYRNFKAKAKNSSGNGEANTASIPTASIQVSPVGLNVATTSISLDTACAYIASQSNGSQIKYEDINQIDEDDIDGMYIKWNMTRFKRRRTGSQGFDAIDGVGWDWSFMANEKENYALVADEEAPTEFALMAKSSFDNEEAREITRTRRVWDTVLFLPPPAQVYSPPKKDMSWTGLPEFADDTITDYSRPSPAIEKCIVLERNFKLTDDTNVLLRTPKQHNMRLGHLNLKTMNKLVRHNLVRGLPSKCFENDHTCVACLKEKQHKASCKTKLVNSVTKPLHTLRMDLFGPTSDETSGIRNFITEIENLKDLKVKIIKYDNGGKFRNKEMNDFCSRKGIKREFSNAGTPQQNRVAEKRNKILIEVARTMLANAKLPVTFWAKAVNTACYVQNRVLVNKSQKKTPYELFNGTNSTNFSGTKDTVSQDVKKVVSSLRYIALLNWFHEAHLESSTSNAQDACNADDPESSGNSNPTATSTNPPADQLETLTVENLIPTVSSPVLTACLNDSLELSSDTRLISKRVTSQDDMPSLDNILALTNRFEDIIGVTTNTDDSNGVEANLGNMENNISASPTPTFRIHKDHPKKVRPIGTKWVLKKKKDEKGIVIRNNARLVDQGHTQEEWIDYDEVFAHVARIEAIRLFLAYASFMGFTVYQMDVNSAFLYGTIDEEFYMMQPLRFQDPEFPTRVYKVEKAMYGLHQAPRAWYDSDYGGATQDRKSTTGGCQFLGRRLISWQCKKQTIMTTSTTEAEYVAAASGCRQVLWIQNQLLDYGARGIYPGTLPLDRVEVLARARGIYPGTLPLDIVEVLGSNHEVSVSTEGVEELKRIVRIKGVKKEALHTTLGRNWVNA
nr:ribonuclease H-like domain-containing protein [Tanacetum cinerariifolium]